MSKHICTLCETRVATLPKVKLCNACYSFMYYWRKKSVAEMMKYLERLGMRRERMSRLLAVRSNVRAFPHARRNRS